MIYLQQILYESYCNIEEDSVDVDRQVQLQCEAFWKLVILIPSGVCIWNVPWLQIKALLCVYYTTNKTIWVRKGKQVSFVALPSWDKEKRKPTLWVYYQVDIQEGEQEKNK